MIRCFPIYQIFFYVDITKKHRVIYYYCVFYYRTQVDLEFNNVNILVSFIPVILTLCVTFVARETQNNNKRNR